ncbi:MAG: hypothetical protein J0I41_15480 [Filimonas sp.]|nr:hypothetical protein [Filimonas sp.]
MRLPIIAILSFSTITGFAQNFQALHGSPYAGSMGTDYNPAAALNMPYKWDLTILGLQQKSITNAFYIENAGLFTTDTAYVKGKNGYFRRYAHASNAINLFHFSYRIKEDKAVSFGINLRNYVHGSTTPFYWNDTLTNDALTFMQNNAQTPMLKGQAQTSSWVEYNLGYSQVLKSNELGRWQAGVQLHIMQGIAGGFGRLDNISFQQQKVGNTTDFLLTDTYGRYGYSKNADALDSNLSTGQNIRNFLKGNKLSLGLDLGIEYVRYYEDPVGNSTSSPADYDWKIGVSLLDIGKNRFEYGKESAIVSGAQPNIYVSQLENKFTNVKSASAFNDSVRTVVGHFDTLRGTFSINNPARMLINIDKSLPNNFYVNAELQIQFASTRTPLRLNTRELSVLTVTPRWETKNLGVYLPVQYTTEANLWVGLGLKAGPLVVGLHNLGWLFGRNSLPNGGGYIGIQIRAKQPKERDKWLCPTTK